ncbi:MAG: RDD family protein [Rickettsiales bacterium]|nr:RDD family protein [Rickettsiales bacterium]
MKEEKNIKVSSNAEAFRRIIGFTIDSILVNFLIIFFVQIFVFNSKNIGNIGETMTKFKELFGNVRLLEFQDYHIRFIVNNGVFDYFLLSLYVSCAVAILYNFLCYVFLKGSTIGQKCMSLKVVNITNYEKPNNFKLFMKSVLVPFPIILMYVMVFCLMLYLVNFHLYAPMKNIGTIMIIKLTSVSSIYLIGIVVIVFLLFWFDIYYITDRLILSDIISRTRVVNKKVIDAIEIENIKNRKDIIYYIDKFIEVLTKINKKLQDKLVEWINYLKNKFSGNKK